MANQGILVLAGSGEFTRAMEAIDKYLLSLAKNPVVAIIPTAAGEESDYDKWIKDGVGHFEKLGAEVYGVHLIKRWDAGDKGILKQLEDANFYYFSGGNPGYLLDTIKDTPAWKLIHSRFISGATLVGSSAGAMVMGKKVWARVYDFRRGIAKPWEEGLGVVDFGVVPHYDYMQNNFSEEKLQLMEKNYPKDVPLVGIDEYTVYIQINGKWEARGKGQIHKL